MANFVKNCHFLWSGMTLLNKKTNKTRSQVIPDPKKWPFFKKWAIKNSKPYFFGQNFDMSKCLSVRASTDIKSGQKFQQEPG
jgi:hypothetical protein